MKSENKFWLRWKGVDCGPYTRQEIERMLARGDIGLFHEVVGEDASTAQLRAWLGRENALPRDDERALPPVQRERLRRAYLLGGLCFVAPPVLALALLNAEGLSDAEKRRTQRRLALILTLFGTLFWVLLFAAW